MNDNAVHLLNRVVCIAGKHRSHRFGDHLWEPSLLAKNDNAVCPTYRVD